MVSMHVLVIIGIIIICYGSFSTNCVKIGCQGSCIDGLHELKLHVQQTWYTYIIEDLPFRGVHKNIDLPFQ